MEGESGRRARPLIPANYITLRQLQEEKINRKMREEEERKRMKEEEQEVREHKIIKEEEEVELKKKKKEEEINRKIENEAVKSEWIDKVVTEDAGEERKPKSKEKNNKRKGRKGANKKEEGEEGEQTKGEEKMKEAARGDRVSRLKTYPKNRKPDTSGEPVELKKKKKKKKEEEINRKIENEAVKSEWSGKVVTEDAGEERKPKSKEKNNERKGRKGANKKEEGEVGEQMKGEEKMKEAARGDRVSRLKTYPKNLKSETSGEPVLCLTVDEDDDREAISSSSSSNLRDRQLRNMQRVGKVTKAIEVLNLGEKGGGAFVNGGMAGERKRLVSGGRGGGRRLGRLGSDMVWVKKSAM